MSVTAASYNNQEAVKADIMRLASMGLSLHYLQENSKQPIGYAWQKAPVKTVEELMKDYKPKFNLGCRTGAWSQFSDGTYCAVIDVDLKGGNDYLEAALSHVKNVLGDNLSDYPYVKSPRGFHYYVRCNIDELPSNQLIAHSEELCEIEMNGKMSSRRCWEVDFFSTGKQIVLPPSTHPDIGTVYEWGKRFDSFTEIPLLPSENLLKLKKINNDGIPNDVPSLDSLAKVDIENITVPLKLPEKLRLLIMNGAEKGRRSEAMFSTATQLLKLGISERDIVAILTDSRYKISEKALEKGGFIKSVGWVYRYCITPAKKAIKFVNEDSAHLKACSVVDFISMTLPPRELILAPWLPTSGLCMIHAIAGIGKTHLSFGTAYAVASGGSFLKWKAEKARGVLLIDGELSANLAQERWKLTRAIQSNTLMAPLLFVTPDLQSGCMPDLATIPGQTIINELITDEIELIIVDNLSCLVRTGNENEAEQWAPIQAWALRLRAQGKSVLFIHHSSKGGSQRGTSKKVDVLDSMIMLKRSETYTQDQGATFEVHFEKSRGFCGDDATPFEASLTQDEQGLPCWTTRSLEDSDFDKVIKLLNKGISQKEIAETLKVSKSTISRHATRARNEGLIKVAEEDEAGF